LSLPSAVTGSRATTPGPRVRARGLARIDTLLDEVVSGRPAYQAPVAADVDPSPEEYARFARTAVGDAARGRALFADSKGLACARCHNVRGERADVGPDLSDIAGKFLRDLLIELVLDLSRQIVEGYRPSIVATVDGRVLAGIVKEESAAEPTLVAAEGRRQVVRKSETEERRSVTTSIMPVGLVSGLPARIRRRKRNESGPWSRAVKHRGGRGPSSGTPGPGAGRRSAADLPQLVRRVFEALVARRLKEHGGNHRECLDGPAVGPLPLESLPALTTRARHRKVVSPHPPLRAGRGRLARIQDVRRCLTRGRRSMPGRRRRLS
jgi:putative heme-binding domain-containing protein